MGCKLYLASNVSFFGQMMMVRGGFDDAYAHSGGNTRLFISQHRHAPARCPFFLKVVARHLVWGIKIMRSNFGVTCHAS